MFFNTGSNLYAVDAATGVQKWKYTHSTTFSGGGRGPAYGDGVIYAYGRGLMYAVDAKTGKAVESFGNKGTLAVAAQALHFKYPGKYPANLNAEIVGTR
jgi:outer membrane protein assembly factor BamB